MGMHWRSDWVIFVIFSTLNDSMILSLQVVLSMVN